MVNRAVFSLLLAFASVTASINRLENSLKKKGKPRSRRERKNRRNALKKLRKLKRSKVSLECKTDAMICEYKECENNPFHPLYGLTADKYRSACFALFEADDAMAAASGGISLARGASQETVNAIIARMNVGGNDLKDARECCQFYADLSFIKKAIDVLAEKGAKANQEKVQTFLEKLVSLEMDDSEGRTQIMEGVEEVFNTTPTCNFDKHIVSTTPTVRPRTAAIVALKDAVIHPIRDNQRLTDMMNSESGLTWQGHVGTTQGTKDEDTKAKSTTQLMVACGLIPPTNFSGQLEIEKIHGKKVKTPEDEERLTVLMKEREEHYRELLDIIENVMGCKCKFIRYKNGHFHFSTDNTSLKPVPTMTVLPFWLMKILMEFLETIVVSSKSGSGISHAYCSVMNRKCQNELPGCAKQFLYEHCDMIPTHFLLKFPDVKSPACCLKTVSDTQPILMLGSLVPPTTELKRSLERGMFVPKAYNGTTCLLNVRDLKPYVVVRYVDANREDVLERLRDACSGSL
jgi:hypothetical protein